MQAINPRFNLLQYNNRGCMMYYTNKQGMYIRMIVFFTCDDDFKGN